MSADRGILAIDQHANVHFESNSSLAGNLLLAGAQAQLHLEANATVSGSLTDLTSTQVKIERGASVAGGTANDAAAIAIAVNGALSVSAGDAGLPATMTVPGGAINLRQNAAQTVTGGAGLNVLDLSALDLGQSSVVTLNAPATGTFVVNVSGEAHVQQNAQLLLAGGLVAQHVVINFTGTNGDIHLEQGSSGSGAILAVNRNSTHLEQNVVWNGQILVDGQDLHLEKGVAVNTPACLPPAEPRLFVGNAGDNTVTIYNQPFTSASTPAVTLTNGLNPNPNPNSVAFDASGTLYVANYLAGNVTTYSAPFTSGSAASVLPLTGLGGPQDLLFSSTGDLYVSNYNAGTVTIYHAGTWLQSATTITGLGGPQQMAFDAAGNLYVGSRFAGVNIYAPPFTGAPTTISTGVASPQGVGFDAYGNLYVANQGSSTVQIYSPPFAAGSSPVATISSGVSGPFRVAFDPAGNLYVTNGGANTVTVYAPSASNPPFGSSSTPTATIATGTTPVGVVVH